MGCQVLWEAALAGSSRDVLVAIRKGGNPEWPNTCGKTPLLCAAAAGHPAIVQLLLEQVARRSLAWSMITLYHMQCTTELSGNVLANPGAGCLCSRADLLVS